MTPDRRAGRPAPAAPGRGTPSAAIMHRIRRIVAHQAPCCNREIAELSEVARPVNLGHDALRVGGVLAEDLRPGDPNDKLGGYGQPHVVLVVLEICDALASSRQSIRAGRRTPGPPVSAPPLPFAPAALT